MYNIDYIIDYVSSFALASRKLQSKCIAELQ